MFEVAVEDVRAVLAYANGSRMSRVLFDQGVPGPLRRFLPGHTVETARRRGWGTLTNGDLLRRAEAAGFEVLVMADQNLRHQQNLSGRTIALVIVGTNLWPVIAIDPAPVARAVDAAGPGSIAFVGYPKPRLVRRPWLPS